jgi:hypothetical protein
MKAESTSQKNSLPLRALNHEIHAFSSSVESDYTLKRVTRALPQRVTRELREGYKRDTRGYTLYRAG